MSYLASQILREIKMAPWRDAKITAWRKLQRRLSRAAGLREHLDVKSSQTQQQRDEPAQWHSAASPVDPCRPPSGRPRLSDWVRGTRSAHGTSARPRHSRAASLQWTCRVESRRRRDDSVGTVPLSPWWLTWELAVDTDSLLHWTPRSTTRWRWSPSARCSVGSLYIHAGQHRMIITTRHGSLLDFRGGQAWDWHQTGTSCQLKLRG